MNKVKPLIKHIPFIMLLMNGISFVAWQLEIYLFDHYWYANLGGHSLLTCIYMAFFAYLHRCCLYTIICIVSLGLLNLLNIVYFFLPLGYYQLYSGIIIITGIVFAIKWKS